MQDSSQLSTHAHTEQRVCEGFLLTRQSRDRSGSIEITLWIKTATGPIKCIVSNELAVFFVITDCIDKAITLLEHNGIALEQSKNLPLKNFSQQKVSGLYFKTMLAFYAARELLRANEIKCFEDDFRPDDRFLMERFITANIEVIGELASFYHSEQQGFDVLNNAKCRKLAEQTRPFDLQMLSVDIECSMKGELYSIGAYAQDASVVFMIGIPKLEEPMPKSLTIYWVKDELALLNTFISWLNDYDPDIIIGWNVINFDMDLLQKRCDKHDVDFVIGRDGSVPYWRKNSNSGQKFIEIAGRVVLDGIDLLKTATYSFPSFSLDYVSRELLGLSKKVEDVDNRVSEITDNFLHNKIALAKYNLEDCRLVWLIFEKTQLLSFAQLRAQLTGLEIDRIGGSVAAYTNLYLPKLHRSQYVAPNMGDGASSLVSPGGYVMDSIPGLYEHILVLDFKSLYPSIIRTFNIDPMGLIEGLKAPERAIEGFDGALFSREQHFLPEIIRSLWAERDKAKAEKNSALSQAIKIIMNSFYGVLGSSGCRFFDPRLSGSITKRSHELLKLTKSWIEGLGHQVIYGDTDSIFVHLSKESLDECLLSGTLTIDVRSNANIQQKGDLNAKAIDDVEVNQACRKIGKELETFINNKVTKDLKERFNVVSELEIEFETHFTKFIMPTIRGSESGSKKRYAGIVIKEGQQQLIFKGLESVRTDWTELAKVFQRELYHRVFNKLPVKDYVLEMVNKTKSGEFDDLLVYRKRIRRKLDEYVKNVPPHIRAARFADDKNKELGLPLKYQQRGWVEYFMTLNGPQTREFIDNSLDYQLYVDRQLEPVADAILPFIGTSFSEIVDAQLNLFS